jgi:hypothetical protein
MADALPRTRSSRRTTGRPPFRNALHGLHNLLFTTQEPLGPFVDTGVHFHEVGFKFHDLGFLSLNGRVLDLQQALGLFAFKAGFHLV